MATAKPKRKSGQTTLGQHGRNVLKAKHKQTGECFEFRSSPDDSFYLSMERGPFVKEPQRVK